MTDVELTGTFAGYRFKPFDATRAMASANPTEVCHFTSVWLLRSMLILLEYRI
jgi:hypothetical protein